MLQCDHYMPPDRYNPIVEGSLRDTSFYHVSHIRVVQCQSALVNALVERWRPETHTFYFPVGECAVTLEDVALILGLPTNDLPVTRPTLSSYEALEAECLDQFGVALMNADCRGSFIKLQGCTESFCRYSVTLPGSYSSVGDRPAWHTCGITGNVRISLTDFVPLRTIGENWILFGSLVQLEELIRTLRRKFGLTQGVPNQERDLGEAHGEVLTGSKNQDWSGTHSFWVMHWTNRYSHVLVNDTVPSQHQADIYLHWYRGTYDDHLHLSQIEPQENQHGDPMHNQENQQVQSPPPPSPPQPPPPPSQTQAQQEREQFTPYIPDTHYADYLTPPVYQQYWSVPHQESGEQGLFSQLLGFMAPVPGYSYPTYRDIPTDQMAQPSGIAPGRLSLDTRPRQLTSSGTSGGRLSVDSSMSDDATRGIIQSGIDRRVPMNLILESYQLVDEGNNDFLVDHPHGDEVADEDDDEDEDDNEDEADGEDEDDASDGPDDDSAPTAGTTTSEKGKGYNLRADPPRQSASRYTPSAFKKVAKKCKKLVKDVKWAMRK
ncbi:uncharacterized protein DS421_20g705190 [Arachis hypogaea]|nr:uncharacterized protein DS421_20g705190 [Arachis hypogaea]